MDWYDAAKKLYEQTFPQDCQLSALPAEWQRELVALMLVNQEVNNGGYLQFLANQGRETYVRASRALKAIGAHRMAGILDRCQALVDEHFPSRDGSNDDLRALLPNQIIDSQGRTIKEAGSILPEPVLDRIHALSYEFMEYPDDVDALVQARYGSLLSGAAPGMGAPSMAPCRRCGSQVVQKSRLRLALVGGLLQAGLGLGLLWRPLQVLAICFSVIGVYLLLWAFAGRGRWCRECKRFDGV